MKIVFKMHSIKTFTLEIDKYFVNESYIFA